MGKIADRIANSKLKLTQHITITAIRNCKDGTKEICSFRSEFSAQSKLSPKDALLQEICCNDWAHNPPADYILQYFLQTESYKHSKGRYDGCVLNFYESDYEFPERFSLRGVALTNAENAKLIAKNFIADEMSDEQYSIKTY